MRLSNAFHTYELVFVFLINYLNISVAWGKGKYFSDYEYPEIQLLFSAKEENNGESGSKTDIIQDKDGFSPILNSDSNSYLEASERRKLSNEQISKPWMRGPWAEDLEKEKTNSDDEKERNAEELKLPEEREASKNDQFGEITPDEERQFLQRDDKSRKIVSSYINPQKEPYHDLDNEIEPRKIKFRKRLKFQNHNRMPPIRVDLNKRFKNQVVKAWHGDDADIPRCEGSDTSNYIASKQNKNVALANSHVKLYSGSRISPEYEGNNQEYDELTGVLNKNQAMAVNNNPTTKSAVSPTKDEGLLNSSKQNYDLPVIINEKVDVANVRSTVTNKPMKGDPTHVKVTNSNEKAVNSEMTLGNGVQSSITENSKSVSVVSPSATTPSVLSCQEIKADLKPNVSKANEGEKKENGMVLRQPNRVVQENHPLLAKPPVKIAGTLIDKHSEDDSEVNIEEKGTKIVKVAQISQIMQSSTVLASTGLSISPQKHAADNTQEQGTAKTVHFVETYDPSPKKKRNTNENKNVNTKEGTRQKSANVALPKKIEDSKISEKKSHSELIDSSIDLDNDEQPEPRKSKFIKPQYYSLSKSNSALGMVNNLLTRLRPRPAIKKKKVNEEKFNDSFKRNIPSTYDLAYDSGYDYYRSKGGKKGDPIRAYYDYENDFDLNYDKDYPRISHLNNTGLAAEKEFYEYDGKSYLNNLSRSRNKSKRKKYRKVEENYRDIFAHPISLDDPELQIVRDDEDELINAKRRLHHKNFATRHHREKTGGKESLHYQNDRSVELESLPRSHLKKKKTEQAPHPRHNNVEIAQKQAIIENEESDKKIH